MSGPCIVCGEETTNREKTHASELPGDVFVHKSCK